MQQATEMLEAASPPVFTVEGPRATIRLNRPRHVNRIQAEDLLALLELFDKVEADPAIRVLVITGTGRAFSAGYDLNSVAERSAATTGQTAGSAFGVMVDRLEDLGVPTICRLNGGVYGGSTDLALACDFRIGVDTSEMFMPAARLGLIVPQRHPPLRRAARRRQCEKAVPDRPEDRRERNVADRLSHRHGAGGGPG